MFSVIRMSRVIVPFLLASGMCACVDDEYDLDKDISLEVGIGGKYFAIPLGSTDSIRVDSLLELDDESVFMFMEDGTATITKSDEVDVRVPEIRQVTISGWESEIEPIEREVLVPEDAQGEIGVFPLPEEELSSSSQLEFNEEVPDELVALKSVKFDGTPKLVIDIQFEAPEEAELLELRDYTIAFPKFIVFDDELVNEYNQLIINKEIDVELGYHAELDIAEFKFAESENPIANGRLYIADEVTLNGKLALAVNSDGNLPATVKVAIIGRDCRQGECGYRPGK